VRIERRRVAISDGPMLSMTRNTVDPSTLTCDPYQISLNNYAAWLTLQPYSTIAAILDVTANELYRRQEWTTIAGQVKEAGKDLRAGARQEVP
jgi:hypothetical protein